MGKIGVLIVSVMCVSLFACSEASPNETEIENVINHSLDLNKIKSSEETETIVVKKGDKVSLVISSRVPKRIHLHGYDIEKSVPSNGEIYMEFEANATGRFQITSHQSDGSSGDSIEGHGELFKSDVLEKGDSFTYKIEARMDGKTILYHDHMKHGNEGKIIVSLQDGRSGEIQIKVNDEGHAFHPSVVTVKPGSVISWEVEKNDSVKITSGLPPKNHSSSSHGDGHDDDHGDEEILAILEVRP